MHYFPRWPSFTGREAEVINKVLLSGNVNYWTGEEGRLFEQEFAEYCGVNCAIAVANGTVALELALMSLRINHGDEVIVTSRTFIASASAIVSRGAVPIFADVDPVTQNISVDSIRQVITPRSRAIIAVHLAGWPCDMDAIMALADSQKLKVVEDCAQAHGAIYKGRKVGSIGHVAAFSFCQDKIMSTGGEGGMVTTNDPDLWRAMWAYKDHGKSYSAVYEQEHPPGFRWLHESFGSNYRLTEMQSAIGRLQLRKLDGWLAQRRANAEYLERCFRTIPGLRVTSPTGDVSHAYYKYYVFVEPAEFSDGWDRDRVMAAVIDGGVPCFSGSCSEIYLEKAFEGTGWQPSERLPNARMLGETSLMFPVHPTLGEEQMAIICKVVQRVMASAVGSS